MAISYINTIVSKLYKSPNSNAFETILIYGDEIETLNQEQNDRIKVKTRSKIGWVNKNELMSNPVLEIYFIDVGQGDSTFIVTPSRKKILIDGGKNDHALRFLSWKYRLDQGGESTPVLIDLLVLTHADDDHIAGLVPIIRQSKFKIKKIIHSGIARFKDGFETELGDLIVQNDKKYLTTSHDTLNELSNDTLSKNFLDWKKAIIADRSIDYHAVDSTTGIIDIGDPNIIIEVIGPKVEKMTADGNKIYEWFSDKPHTINGHSVVLRLTYNKVKLLLSGDINIAGQKNLLENHDMTKQMDAHILKAPHHGSHEYLRKWLDAVNPQISIISSGDEPDYGHPRANFIADIGNASRVKSNSLVFATEIAATYVGIGKDMKDIGLTDDEKNDLKKSTLEKLRNLFKLKIYGMINVRTDGNNLYAARRINSPTSLWEYYGPLEPSPRSILND